MLNGSELENLLLSWQKKYGEEHLNKQGNVYYKISDMRTALNALVNTFISIGYDYEDFQSSLLSSQIQRSVTPYKYGGKLAEWRLMIDKQWKNAINDYFPDTRLQEAIKPKEIGKPTVILEKTIEKIEEKVLYVERPLIDKSKIKGLVIPEYTIVENDPLAFLKKGKNE